MTKGSSFLYVVRGPRGWFASAFGGAREKGRLMVTNIRSARDQVGSISHEGREGGT
jgi:hypothetical protein